MRIILLQERISKVKPVLILKFSKFILLSPPYRRGGRSTMIIKVLQRLVAARVVDWLIRSFHHSYRKTNLFFKKRLKHQEMFEV